MGIKNFQILSKAGNYGAVPKNINVVGIYLDAEFLHFKGRVYEALNHPTPELEIAIVAHKYTIRLLAQLKSMFKDAEYTIYAYFDGTRNMQKGARSQPDLVCRPEIVKFYKKMLSDDGIKIVQLDVGESELLMYLNRDVTNDLNIFVSGDSDMYSILYNHQPTNPSTKTHKETFESTLGKVTIDVYDDDGVKDSALWVFIHKDFSIIACDNMNFNMSTRQFRQFTSLLGTDYTPPILTRTMAQSVIQTAMDKPVPEDLTDLEFFIVIIIYGFMYKYSRKPLSIKSAPGKIGHIITNANSYYKYVTTGKCDVTFCKSIDSAKVINFMLQALYGVNTLKDLKSLPISTKEDVSKLSSWMREYCQVETDEEVYWCDLDNIKPFTKINKKRCIRNKRRISDEEPTHPSKYIKSQKITRNVIDSDSGDDS